MARTEYAIPMLFACSCGFSDLDTGGEGALAPDISGIFSSEIVGREGCEALLPSVPLTGFLSVSGPPESLTFSWDALSATGQVDASFAVALSGSGSTEEGLLELVAEGVVSDDGGWILDLVFELALTPSDTGGGACEVTGTILGSQQS